MTLNKSSQLLLAATASLFAAAVVTACSSTPKVDFVYVASSTASGSNSWGQIDVFEIDSQSGAMNQIPSAPYPSQGRNPVAMALESDNANLYVASKDDHAISQFNIGGDGKLYPIHTTNTTGYYPMALAVSGNTLYVLNTYLQVATCTDSSPCSGSVSAFPINTSSATDPATQTAYNGALQTALANGSVRYWPLAHASIASSHILAPAAITSVTVNGATYLYVAAYDSTASPHVGYIFTYWRASSASSTPPSGASCPAVVAEGTLCQLTAAPIVAGVQPSALAVSPDGSTLYAADASSGKIWVYSGAASGSLALASSVYSGAMPSALVINSKGTYLYAANKLDGAVAVFTVSGSALTRLGVYASGTQPVAIGIEPQLGKYLYTVNYQVSSISGFTIWSDGSLVSSQDSPYKSDSYPTAAVAVARH